MVSGYVRHLFNNAGDLTYQNGTSNVPVNRLVLNIPIIATTVDANIFVADTDYDILSIAYVPTVASSGSGTVRVNVCNGTEAPASGDAAVVAFDLDGTANVIQEGTMTGTNSIAAGERLAIDVGGTMTSAVGVLTIVLRRR